MRRFVDSLLTLHCSNAVSDTPRSTAETHRSIFEQTPRRVSATEPSVPRTAAVPFNTENRESQGGEHPQDLDNVNQTERHDGSVSNPVLD